MCESGYMSIYKSPLVEKSATIDGDSLTWQNHCDQW